MFQKPYRLVPIVMGIFTYYVVLDAEGYPVAQGSLEACQQAMQS